MRSSPRSKKLVKPPLAPATAKRARKSPVTVTTALVASDGTALLNDLQTLVRSARTGLATFANATYTHLCWQVGRRLLRENLLAGRAAYGKQILATLSQELTAEFGAGFSYTALTRMARFAEWMIDEKILATLSQTLGWNHFVELLPIKDPLARDFYAEMCRIERWDVRTLRQKIGGMFVPAHRPVQAAREGNLRRDRQAARRTDEPRHRVPRPLPAGLAGPPGRLQRA